ncbi:MAG: SRPBCC family protein [Acidobacteriota bacterium]|nr:SRPBCC family protein [Acidobacteriota bacterium]
MLRRLLRIAVILVLLVALAGAVLAAIGLALPASHEATRSARIDAPPAAIYPMLLTPEMYPDWRTGVERVDRLDSDRFREHGPHGPMIFRITTREAPSRVVTAVDDPDQPFTGTWTFDLVQEGEQTRVRITERGAVPNPLFRSIARLFMSQTATLETYLKDIGRRFGQDVAIER